MTTGDDPVGVRDDGAVVEEEVNVILGGEQSADVAVEHKVWLVAPLDRLGHIRVDAVDQVAKPATVPSGDCETRLSRSV